MSRMDREGARLTRDDLDQRARKMGHHLTWKLGSHSNRKGYAYFFTGHCGDCGAEVTAGSCWSSCPSVRDARKVTCSGPGTVVLTEIETDRAHELIAAAVNSFVTAITHAGDHA